MANNTFEFKGTKEDWYAVDFAGSYFILDGINYESRSLLDSDQVGEIRAKANAQLVCHSFEMLSMIDRLASALEDIQRTLAHHNHSVTGFHLNGNEEPIMNFFNDIDMSSIEDAKLLITKATAI